MGEIVIKIPSRKKRRYVMTDTGRVEELIAALERSAVRIDVNNANPTRQEIEDIRDYEAARRNLEEMRKTGKSYTVDELRKEFGLL